jgi:Glu-tRNA(Gln) amidotransferase subunit E-like FAD-binding protein
MRVDALHLLQVALRQQVLLHAQLDLGADLERRGEQQVEGAADRAFARVLHGNNSELGSAGLAAPEGLVDCSGRHRFHRGAEMLAHRLLAERALGPEVGDADRLLQAAAGGDDFAEHRDHPLLRKNI